jgi:E3 ubiquitin-protein ligase BRE1
LDVVLSELARVKALLAAQAGDHDLVAFFAMEKSGDITYVDSLKERLACV